MPIADTYAVCHGVLQVSAVQTLAGSEALKAMKVVYLLLLCLSRGIQCCSTASCRRSLQVPCPCMFGCLQQQVTPV